VEFLHEGINGFLPVGEGNLSVGDSPGWRSTAVAIAKSVD
jgi:hypothetical protein